MPEIENGALFSELSKLRMDRCFKDYFSGNSSDYCKHRPSYPPELFSYLSSLTKRRYRAWDCATGNGQAARGIALYFAQVIATDGSFSQILNAPPSPNVHFAVSLAEFSCFKAQSLDLITVGQAMHWLDFAAFFAEVDRLLVKNGILAFWCYGLARISPAIDEVIGHFFFSVLGPFWPPERRYIEEEYRTIPLPMSEIPAPPFAILAAWDLDAMLGYLGTWSAVKLYRKQKREDPISLIMTQLCKAWGERKKKRTVTWPIFLRMGRK